MNSEGCLDLCGTVKCHIRVLPYQVTFFLWGLSLRCTRSHDLKLLKFKQKGMGQGMLIFVDQSDWKNPWTVLKWLEPLILTIF